MSDDPSDTTDPDDYNPAGPVRTFMAKVQFVNAGPMPPMKVELPMTETTEPDLTEYTEFERKLAQGMNEDAYAPHEESWAKDKWPIFLPHARAAIRALIGMGVCLS